MSEIGDGRAARPGDIELTSQEKRTHRLRRRIDIHIAEWWPELLDKEKYPYIDPNHIIDDGPRELWRYEFFTRPPDDEFIEGRKSKTIWFLWNGKEVKSYPGSDEAITDMIIEKRERQLESKLRYFTSPLTISAVLAVLLLCLIAALELVGRDVPQQLWSVFTAVVAFYFGRETSAKKWWSRGTEA